MRSLVVTPIVFWSALALALLACAPTADGLSGVEAELLDLGPQPVALRIEWQVVDATGIVYTWFEELPVDRRGVAVIHDEDGRRVTSEETERIRRWVLIDVWSPRH